MPKNSKRTRNKQQTAESDLPPQFGGKQPKSKNKAAKETEKRLPAPVTAAAASDVYCVVKNTNEGDLVMCAHFARRSDARMWREYHKKLDATATSQNYFIRRGVDHPLGTTVIGATANDEMQK